MNINFEYYKIFYYVAKCGNFTQAANILFNNQPNITRSIKNLENQLGCKLFIRNNRGASLTPEGERLFAHISMAVKHIHAGEEDLLLGKTLQSGTVTIGATENALHGLLISVLRDFRLKHPGIKIRVLNYSTPQAIAAVNNGEVDLAVVTSPTNISKPLIETKIKVIDELLVCGKEYRNLTLKTLHLSDLTKIPFISLTKGTKTYEFYNHLFSQNNLTFSPDMEAATTDLILPMIKNNLGIGFVPSFFAEDAIKKGEVFPLKIAEKIPKRYICSVKSTEKPFSIAAKELEHILFSTDL